MELERPTNAVPTALTSVRDADPCLLSPTSALERIADSNQTSREVRKVPIVLKKSFLDDERNFLGPLMRFARGDVRGHIVLHKNDHGPSYRPYRPLQRSRRLKIDLREIFEVVRFS